MNILHSISIASVIAASSMAAAGPVVDLAPSEIYEGLSGINNSEFTEIIGAAISDKHIDFAIYGQSQNLLYEGTLMTRVVRSHQSGNLHMNYRILNGNGDPEGRISNVEIAGFSGMQTRVEYRDDASSPGVEGPFMAHRYITGDIIDFGFDGGLNTADNSHYFFAMVDTDTFYEDANLATIYLETGESVSMMVDSVSAMVPAPGSIALLGGAGLLCSRRRR